MKQQRVDPVVECVRLGMELKQASQLLKKANDALDTSKHVIHDMWIQRQFLIHENRRLRRDLELARLDVAAMRASQGVLYR